MNDKRGSFPDVLYAIVSMAAFAIFLLLVGYIATTLSGEVQDKIGSDDARINNSFETTTNVANGTLTAVWYLVFFGLLLGLVVSAWFTPSYPIMAVPFIILLVIAVIIGVALSNLYEEVYEFETFSSIASTQTSINFILSHLPITALAIGIISLIITFTKPRGAGGTPIA